MFYQPDNYVLVQDEQRYFNTTMANIHRCLIGLTTVATYIATIWCTYLIIMVQKCFIIVWKLDTFGYPGYI